MSKFLSFQPPKKLLIIFLLTVLFWYLQTYRVEEQQPLSLAFSWLLGEKTKKEIFQGYIEGEFLHLASPLAGTLIKLPVQRGTLVSRGDPLFTLDTEPEASTVREAEQRLKAAQARLADLKKGQRPSEIDAITARLVQAKTDLELAKLEQTRYEALFRQKMVQTETLDTARATTQRQQARVEEMEAQLRTANLMARADLITAAEAEVATAQVNVAKSQWWLAQKQVTAPQGGQVIETFYEKGEWVAAGNPVIALLPPERIKVRFFVNEEMLGKIHLGQKITLTCDNCPPQIPATVTYLSPQAEYTAVMIYNRENRAKLTYLVEAAPEQAIKLHPGQPVDVEIK